MQPGYESKIEINPETGQRCLIVIYNSQADDFDEAIKQATAFHSIRPGQMNVIALPDGFWKWGKTVGMRYGHTSQN